MAILTALSRHASPVQRFVFLVVVILCFLASIYYLDLLPGHIGFTTTEGSSNSHIVQQTVAQPSAKATASPSQQLHEAEHNGESSCDRNLAHLRDLGLSRNVTYSRRCIKPIASEQADRATVTTLISTLLTNTTAIDLEDSCSVDLESLPCDPIELPVPPADPKSHGQYAHLLFGIATNSQRLKDSKATFAHWLADSGAVLVCVITDGTKEAPAMDFEALEADYAASGMKLKLVKKHATHHSPEQSHMMVIRDMLSHSTILSTKPHWFGILDDDTFIPSLHALSTELRRHNHARSKYIGALTEDANSIRQGILAAWGGAGIFLSLALVKEIEPHLDDCLAGGSPGGDMLIMQCVHAHSHTRLTVLEGLWQMDFFGDTAGFYESGRRALSMHHWKSWHWLPVREMAAITRICGDCFLQRFVFAPGSGVSSTAREKEAVDAVAVLNLGYSINVYTGIEGLPDLTRTEQTWDGVNAWQDYEWSVGPLRPKVDKARKKTWWLKTAAHGQNGELIQVYLHEGKGDSQADEVIELVWQP